jgi:DNA-binding MarR family transcriptional regulator
MTEPTTTLWGLHETRRQWDAAGRAAGDAMEFAYTIVRAQQHLISHFEQVLATIGLTFARFECLVALYYSPDSQLGLKSISDRLGVHPTSITYAVDQLEKQELIVRNASPDDRRRKLATLTRKGRARVEKALDLLEATQFGSQGVDPDDQRRTTATLKQLLASEAPPLPPSRRTKVSAAGRKSANPAGRPMRGGAKRAET